MERPDLYPEENRLFRVFFRHLFGNSVGCVLSSFAGVGSSFFSRFHGVASGFFGGIGSVRGCFSSFISGFDGSICCVRSGFFDDRGFFNNRCVFSRSLSRCAGCESQGGSAQSDDILHDITPDYGLATERRHSIRQA